ncbi:MAG TPA: hypothetical protein VMZ91_00085 [Candidatus Paceibacterota bacterium]|nr:hypothetical protein [Candidatus Paceibacterota bacterium]
MRKKLIEKLAGDWRNAENYFLKTESDILKWKVQAKQKKANLTKQETKELNEILTSMGV